MGIDGEWAILVRQIIEDKMWLLVSAVTVYCIILILCLCQVFSLLCVAQGAPQYGGGVSQPARQPAPAQSSPQVSCRTEYAEVWDTEYVETETQECQTVQVKQCNTEYQKQCVPKQRQECNTVHKKVPKRVSRRVPKKVCDDGGSYGAVNRQAETVGTGGVKIRSDAPEKQVKLKTGDAVNFGR